MSNRAFQDFLERRHPEVSRDIIKQFVSGKAKSKPAAYWKEAWKQFVEEYDIHDSTAHRPVSH
jgi:hypothetical protein